MNSIHASDHFNMHSLITKLKHAGVPLRRSSIAEIGRGADNTVLAATWTDGTPVVIKIRNRDRRSRYAIAAWASRRLCAADVPAPDVIWHDDSVCVESRVPGTALDMGAADAPIVEAAVAAGATLRLIHSLPVIGFGRLDATGHAPHPTLAAWLTDRHRSNPPFAGSPLLETRVAQTLRELSPCLEDRPPRLVHGDWVARHVLTRGGIFSGIVDLDSVRGGDPSADLAGWSLQEPAHLTAALFKGYGLKHPDDDTCLRLVLHRIRIGAALARHSFAAGAQDRAHLHARQIEADLDDLDGGRLRAVPRFARTVTATPSRERGDSP